MLLAIIFFNVWGVLQLTALGSFARTLRVRTVLAAIVVGLFFCAPLAVLLESALAGLISALTGRPFDAVNTVAGYTVDPVIEEMVRILPLALLLLVPVVRRQLSVTDYVLIGAATGAGFGLAEDLFRFANAPAQAVSIASGWTVPFQTPYGPSSGIRVFIPSISTALSGWLPDIGGVRRFAPYTLPNLLLIWSALGGLAVGLWLRLDGAKRWYLSAALLAYATSAHAASNADITFGRQLFVTAPFRMFAALEPFLPIAALLIAWRVDRRTQDAILFAHLLGTERDSPRRILGTLRAAVMRMPDSVFLIDRFVRARRACNTERVLGAAGGEALCASLGDMVAPIETWLQQPASWQAAAAEWKDRAQRVLRRPSTIAWIVLALPAIMWFVVGGSPATAGVQRQLSTGPGGAVVLTLTLAAYAFLVVGLLTSLRSWRRVLHLPLADPGTRMALGYLSGIGALLLGTLSVWRAGGGTPGGSAHASEAWESLKQAAAALANAAASLWNAVRDQHIRIPGTERAYITPGGVQDVGVNALIREILNALDRFGLRKGVKAAGGPDLEDEVTLNTHSDDPDDWSEVYGTAAVGLAGLIIGGATGAQSGARGVGRGIGRGAPEAKPPVDPFGKTQPGANPYGKTEIGTNPYARTQPAEASPLAKSVNPPSEPAAGSKPPSAGPVQPGEGPYQTDEVLKKLMKNIPDADALQHMGGPQAFERADAAARSAYNAARAQGMSDAAARQASWDAWNAARGKPPGPTVAPETLPTTDTLRIDDP